MKNYFFLLLLVLPLSSFGQEVSTQKFIRIVGLAEKTLDNEGLKIELTLSEIGGNQYQQIIPKSLEEIKTEFVSALKSNGIDAASLESDLMKNITKGNYNKIRSEHFTLTVANESQASLVSQMAQDGLKVNSINYLFSDSYDTYLDAMTISAIEDAKRKALNIAKSINKKVGEVLNIDDMKNVSNENSSPTSKYGNKSSTKVLRYRVNVTFELL